MVWAFCLSKYVSTEIWYKALNIKKKLKKAENIFQIMNLFHRTFRKLFLRPHRKGSEAETIKSERKNPCTCQICLSEILFHVLFQKLTLSFISLPTCFLGLSQKFVKISNNLKQARLRVILSKGQIKPKSRLASCRFSRKRNGRIWFVCHGE